MSRHVLPTSSLWLTAAAAVATAACAVVIGVAKSSSPGSKHSSSSIARARSRSSGLDKVYPQNVFPGARDVVTPYGTIKVFEWGPEDGEKVLIMHGIGTPSLGYAGLANEFVANGYRVMTYDYFGRGHSDSPTDLPHDSRLYLTQLLLVLASSSISWTGSSAFHLVGYSLGGGLAVSVAAHYPHLLRSLTVICPGGLTRSTHLPLFDRFLYSTGLVPDRLLRILMRRKLDHGIRGQGKDVPVEFEGEGGRMPSWEELMGWQVENNEGFVAAYLSTFQHAPIYDQHERDWKILEKVLSERRREGPPPGLLGGKICVVLGEEDIYVSRAEWEEDAAEALGPEAVDLHILEGGHEIAIAKGKEVAQLAMKSWTNTLIEK